MRARKGPTEEGQSGSLTLNWQKQYTIHPNGPRTTKEMKEQRKRNGEIP